MNSGELLNNKYKIIQIIRDDGRENLYLAVDTDEKKVFIKEFIPEISEKNSNMRDQFDNEIEMLSQIKHPNLPEILEILNEENRKYLIMEFIEGKTFEEIIKESDKPFTEKEVVSWGIKLSEILFSLHTNFQRPVIYRGLNPGHIIITPDDRIKLLDFGSARFYDPEKEKDTFRITSTGYSAPEQIRGEGQSDQKSEVYSLGVILHQMLTKHDPAKTPLNLPPVKNLNPDVSEELDRMINKAIALDPYKRYLSMDRFKHSLEAYYNDYLKLGKKERAKKTDSKGIISKIPFLNRLFN